MPKRSRKLTELSPAQQEIMELVWELGEVSARQIRQRLTVARPVARNTVRTLLERMEEKGWLVHRVEGRTHLYSATQPRQARIGQKVKEVVDTVCEGSAEALVTALIDYRGLTAGELGRIRRMLDEAKATRREPGAGAE